MPAPSIEFVDQSSSGLAYALYPRAVVEHPFPVLAEVRGAEASYTWTLQVIGASHIVTVSQGEHALTEVFACADLPAGGVPLLARKAPLTDAVEEAIALPSLAIEVRIWREVAPSDPGGMPKALVPEADCMAQARYPALPGEPAGETIVGVTVKGPVLRISSVHWYERESIAVLSSTTLSSA